jgi:menaquinone-dependent protoporphyrinogen oxidase
MKTLIAYASKTGMTAKAARLLGEKIKNSDVKDIKHDAIDISAYDRIIVGGSVRMGQVNKAAATFVAKNKTTIMAKPHALFICNAIIDQAPDYIEKGFDTDVYDSALVTDTFGTELDPSKQKGLVKMIAKAALKSAAAKGNKPPEIEFARIQAFADIVNETVALL